MRKTSTALLFSAAIAMATTAPTIAFADDTIKIGVLLIDSGPLASLKETQVKAANLAIAHINAAGGAAGSRLSLSPIPARRIPPWTAPRARSRRMARCSLPEWTPRQFHLPCKRNFPR
jgi:hypothetical protein